MTAEAMKKVKDKWIDELEKAHLTLEEEVVLVELFHHTYMKLKAEIYGSVLVDVARLAALKTLEADEK